MELKTSIGTNRLLLLLLVGLMAAVGVECTRHHQNHHHHHHRQYDGRHHHHQNTHANNDPTSTDNSDNNNGNADTMPGKVGGSGTGGGRKSWRTNLRDDDYDYDEEGERHAYLMTPNNVAEVKDEDDAITSAFEKHRNKDQRPTHHDEGSNSKNPQQPPPEHDVYAYQLPSSLWFIVRYAKDPDGHMEKYMNIVDSFSNYLEKLEKVRTVSVNDLKGVETVFRLTPQHKPFRLH